MLSRELLRWLLAQRAARQLRAVGQDDLAKHSDGRALFAGNEGDGDLVARVQSFPGPTGSFQNRRSEGFDRPVHDFAAIVLHIQKNLAMRVGPIKFRHGSLERYRVLDIIVRSAVVSEDRNANDQQAGEEAKTFN